MSVLKNLAFVYGFVKKDLLFLYNSDTFDEMGMKSDAVEQGLKIGVNFQMVFQSENVVISTGGARGLGS